MPADTTHWLDRARIVAPAGYDRWLVPPCALAIHLAIGMAYGFSVFWLPLSQAVFRAAGLSAPRPCPDLATALIATACDWRVSDLVWVYTLFFVVLGAAAAIWGSWVERVGPRRAGVVAALCWCGGLGIAAIAVAVHQLWLLWLGAGVIGGIGLGIGYITPVSTLIRWFPDRRGVATGMAIMGFGGGAMVGGPFADWLMSRFATPGDVGVWPTFLVLAGLYLAFMLAGAFGFRLPATNATTAEAGAGLSLAEASRTRAFWAVWLVLLFNVSASIGIIGLASPMLQEVFGGRLFGQPELGFAAFDADDKTAAAAIGAGFVGLISLFNIAGRFFWAGLSDRIGRKAIYAVMLALGALLYGLVIPGAAAGHLALFVAAFCLIASMYGGGFAAVPAYLADLFGTRAVGAIHGRLLTAWSVAGVLGPLLVAALRDARIAAGVPRDQVYGPIFLAMAALLGLGFLANLLVGRISAGAGAAGRAAAPPAPTRRNWPVLALAWAPVTLPLLAGAWVTLGRAMVLFAQR